MTRRSIWMGIGVFILAMLATIEPSVRTFALSDISLGGASAEAKGGHRPYHHRPFHRPDQPSIFDTIEDLDVDDGGGPDDDDEDEDTGPDDDDDDDGGSNDD